jgi:hypothetical protein
MTNLLVIYNEKNGIFFRYMDVDIVSVTATIPAFYFYQLFFCIFFGGLEYVVHSFAYFDGPFCISEICLESNPESCRSK